MRRRGHRQRELARQRLQADTNTLVASPGLDMKGKGKVNKLVALARHRDDCR